MKKLALILIFIIVPLEITLAQTVLSSCLAPDSIVAKYRDDADRLAINRVTFKVNGQYTDSVVIDPVLRFSYLKALLAVYNATVLPARDTVITMSNIHRLIEDLHSLSFHGDSNLIWMKNLHNNVIPTGNQTVDSLINKYYLQKKSYSTFLGNFPYHGVVLKTDTNYNIFSLSNIFNSLPGVSLANPDGIFFSSNINITDSLNPNFIELIYKYGWGDCQSGCINYRYWRFRIYHDCSVEYLGSFGNPNPPMPMTIKQNKTEEIFNFYPNPSSNILIVESSIPSFNQRLQIIDVFGRKVSEHVKLQSKTEINICFLQSGVYFLKIENVGQQKMLKFIKE